MLFATYSYKRCSTVDSKLCSTISSCFLSVTKGRWCSTLHLLVALPKVLTNTLQSKVWRWKSTAHITSRNSSKAPIGGSKKMKCSKRLCTVNYQRPNRGTIQKNGQREESLGSWKPSRHLTKSMICSALSKLRDGIRNVFRSQKVRSRQSKKKRMTWSWWMTLRR